MNRIDEHQRARAFVVDCINMLRPGQAIRISRHTLDDIGSAQLVGMLGPTWNAIDNVMENVVGSAFEITAQEDFRTGDVIFYRLKQPLEDSVTYVSPDRRHRYKGKIHPGCERSCCETSS